MWIYWDSEDVVRAVSPAPLRTNRYRGVEVEIPMGDEVLGKRVAFGDPGPGGFRLAVICNWGDDCGIATYTKYLVDALRPLVADLRIFSEHPRGGPAPEGEHDVAYCWRRGESMMVAAQHVLAWRPTAVLVQHEFGIFPKASYWLQLLHRLQGVPTAVALHSVYEHRDKAVCTAAIPSVIVHTETGLACLRRLGYAGNAAVIPHGCVSYPDAEEAWNIYQTPYAIVQFGFGFRYKGVDVALEALATLRRQQPEKYRDVFYTYLCSESKFTRHVNAAYVAEMTARASELGLDDNVAIVRGFQAEQTLCHYLRTNKLAIFPYQADPHNVVYGASGAIRLAMANGIPTVASASPMFDDLEGVLPRPRDAAALAAEIDRVFSDGDHRSGIVARAADYCGRNSWGAAARAYLSFLDGLAASQARETVYLPGDFPGKKAG